MDISYGWYRGRDISCSTWRRSGRGSRGSGRPVVRALGATVKAGLVEKDGSVASISHPLAYLHLLITPC